MICNSKHSREKNQISLPVLAITSLQHLGIAAAINVVPIVAWINGMNLLQHASLLSKGSTMQLKGVYHTVNYEDEPILFYKTTYV